MFFISSLIILFYYYYKNTGFDQSAAVRPVNVESHVFLRVNMTRDVFLKSTKQKVV